LNVLAESDLKFKSLCIGTHHNKKPTYRRASNLTLWKTWITPQATSDRGDT